MDKMSIAFLLFVFMFAACDLFNPNTSELEIRTEEQIINTSSIKYSYPMAIYNDTLALARSNTVKIYKKINNNWVLSESLSLSTGVQNIDIYDSLLLVGGKSSTILLEYNDSIWTQTQLLEASYAVVSIYKNDIVVSSYQGINFFHHNGTNWEEIGTSSNLCTRQKVKLRDNSAFIGEYDFHESRGIIRTFTKNDYWELEDTLTAWDAREGDLFAYDIDVSDDYLIVGAFGDDSRDSINTGSTYIYKRHNDEWIFDEKLFINNANQYLYFGKSVAISNSYAVIGAPNDKENGFMAGAAYLYEKSWSGWKLMAKLVASDAQARDGFGSYIIISDNNNIIIGAENNDKKYYFRP